MVPYVFPKTIFVSITPLLLLLYMFILCDIYAHLHVCGYTKCAHAFLGPRLRSRIFLDHSFSSFFVAGSPNQTKNLSIILVLLSIFAPRILSMTSKAGAIGRPPCPHSVYIGSGDLISPPFTCLIAEQSTQTPHSP